MATKSIAWNTGTGNITLTYQGQGDGPIYIQSDANNGSARSQVITVETVGGAITRNLTVSQAACPFPVGDVKNFSYTGSYQEVELPAGQYKLQCWGAQGGSNAASSSYSITAKAGGKGGYSEGIITLTQKTTVRVYVGGQGSSSTGGFNGGGSTTGSSSYTTGTSGQSGYHYGTSRMGGGGGATDIRLSDGALLSRMIVAGGGSGGAMCYQKKITSEEKTQTINWQFYDGQGNMSNMSSHSASGGNASFSVSSSSINIQGVQLCLDLSSYTFPVTVSFEVVSAGGTANLKLAKAVDRTTWIEPYIDEIKNAGYTGTGTKTITLTDSTYPVLFYYSSDNKTSMSITSTVRKYTETSTTTNTDYQVGGVGGGTQGGGYSSSYVGKQNAAGSGGSFGQGANQTTTNYRYSSGAGGGGWYGGGGGQKSDSSMTYCKYSGGGSGFVNTAASAGNRPSGYTGLQLDSGETKAGNTSFPSTSGGTETGHSGNGYAKITRLA